MATNASTSTSLPSRLVARIPRLWPRVHDAPALSPLPGPWGFLTSAYIVGLIVMVGPSSCPAPALTLRRPSLCIAYRTSSFPPAADPRARRTDPSSMPSRVPYSLSISPRPSFALFSVSPLSSSYQTRSCSGSSSLLRPHSATSPGLTPSLPPLPSKTPQPSAGLRSVPYAVPCVSKL